MEDNTLPEYHQSIFHQLFEHASDIDCKLLLLQQILEMGDERDIPLLEELESHENPKIREKASKVKREVLIRAPNSRPRYTQTLPYESLFHL